MSTQSTCQRHSCTCSLSHEFTANTSAHVLERSALTETDALDVARRDDMEYFIDKILQHRGNLKKKTEIEFLVSWLGYAQEHNSWKASKALRDTEQLHIYLADQKLRYLIPQKFLMS